jgi:periplasmic divalent cation tolerance protein
VVLTTLPDETSAEALARQIVDAGLGACVQLQAIRSVYRWQGETCAEPEWRLAIKTRADRYPALEAYIRARHPYALPQIVMLPITAGAPDYPAVGGRRLGRGRMSAPEHPWGGRP